MPAGRSLLTICRTSSHVADLTLYAASAFIAFATAFGIASYEPPQESGYWLGGEWYKGNFNPGIVIDTSNVIVDQP